MINKEAYTKIFLKQSGKAISDANVKEYMPLWWQNTREKATGGLRLTERGFEFIQEELKLTVYEIPYPKDMPMTTQIIIFLDQFIDCPYFLTNYGIWVTNEKKALELHLFSGDLRKYGLNKAMNRQKKDSENG